MLTASGYVEIVIKINQTEGKALKEVLKEVWELKEEHSDAKIYVEVSR